MRNAPITNACVAGAELVESLAMFRRHCLRAANGLFEVGLALALVLLLPPRPLAACAPAAAPTTSPASPAAMVASKDGAKLFLACQDPPALVELDTVTRAVRTVAPLPAVPTGLALSPDGTRLFVTGAAPDACWCEVDLSEGKVRRSVPLPHTASAPVLSADGTTLWVSLRFLDTVVAFDVATAQERHRIAVTREPISASLTMDGRHLLVAGHLPPGSAVTLPVSARVSVIDGASGRFVKDIVLPNGSTLLRDLRVSPDEKYAAVAHVLGRFQVPTTQADRGWILGNAVSLLDLGTLELLNTVLLDSVDRGSANPWAVGWTPDGSRLCVTHAGTHELSVIDFPALLAKLRALPAQAPTEAASADVYGARWAGEVPDDLAFLVGLRQRVPLAGRGPRTLAISGSRAWVAGFYSGTVETLEVPRKDARPESVALASPRQPSVARRGEEAFNDATHAFQGWQSCASCHSDDARVDGLNWDLLNDGLGNPKNSRSLLFSHRTPPAMSLGVRESAEMAVRAGFRHIQFSVPPEDVPAAIDAWLKGLEPGPSPHRVDGRLSPAARRGRALFRNAEVGCAACHPARLFTDLQTYDVGTAGAYDPPDALFDTPTLVELWRTRPYLHDGSAVSLREVLVSRNASDRHGRTSQLTTAQIDDLIAYLLSL